MTHPPFDQLVLNTERLVLRPLAERDTQSLFDIFSDPDVMRHWSTAPWASIDQARQVIAAEAEELRARRYLRLGVSQKDDGRLIGTCTLFAFVEQSRRADVGYALARSSWGKGLMTEALGALIGYGFETLDLHRLEADIDPRNLASAGILERLGFRKEGHLRERWIVNGEVSDTGFYGLLRSDWIA